MTMHLCEHCHHPDYCLDQHRCTLQRSWGLRFRRTTKQGKWTEWRSNGKYQTRQDAELVLRKIAKYWADRGAFQGEVVERKPDRRP